MCAEEQCLPLIGYPGQRLFFVAVIGRSLHRELAEEGDGLFPWQKHSVGTAEAE